MRGRRGREATGDTSSDGRRLARPVRSAEGDSVVLHGDRVDRRRGLRATLQRRDPRGDDATVAQDVGAGEVAGAGADDERKQLRRFGWSLSADAGSTIAALSLCEGVRELNPILGASPSPGVVIAYSAVSYIIARHDARTTPYWCSSARPIRIAANVRNVVAVGNVAQLAGCGL